MIENEFIKKKTAGIGQYEIDFEKMVQENKEDRHKVRRVKREGDKIEERGFMSDLHPKVDSRGTKEKTFN